MSSNEYIEFRSRRIRAFTHKALAGTAVLIVTLFSLNELGMSVTVLQNAGRRLSYLLPSMIPPQLDSPPNVLGAALESVQVAILGTCIGIVIAGLFAVFAARNITPHPAVGNGIKLFAAFVRSVPALIWALFFVIAVGLGPTPGVLALSVNSLGMLIKAFSESIEEIDMGPIEALRAAGAGHLQVICQGVLPAVAGAFVAWSIFRFDIHVRYASVLGIVGAGGIGWELLRAMRMSRFDAAFGVTLVIFAMVVLTEFFSSTLKRYVLSPVTMKTGSV